MMGKAAIKSILNDFILITYCMLKVIAEYSIWKCQWPGKWIARPITKDIP